MNEDRVAVDFRKDDTGITADHLIGPRDIFLGHIHATLEEPVELQKNIAERLPDAEIRGVDQHLRPPARAVRAAGRSKEMQVGIVGSEQLVGDHGIVKFYQFGRAVFF